MKAKFATWYLLTIVLGSFSETFSNSWNIHKKSGTASFGLIPKNLSAFEIPFNTKTIYSLKRVSDKEGSWKMTEEEQVTTNVTVKENAKREDKYISKLSTIGDYIFGSVLLVSCILALLGNGCALTMFGFRRRKLIPMEVFFINLAIVDILLSVASYPMSIIASFKHVWIFRELGCTVYAFCCYFLGLSSIYTITAMAFTRYLITCKPVQGSQINCWVCMKMIAMGYLLAFLLAAMPLLGFGNYEAEPFGLSCTLDWIAKDNASRVYVVVVTIFCVLFPLVILVFCYSQIIMLVKQSNTLMKNTGVKRQNKERSNFQLTWISGLIAAGFVIAWFPYTIVCLWTSFQGEMVLPMWLSPAPALFAKSSIVYNPVIYVFIIERYRNDFYELVDYISCKSFVFGETDRIGQAKNETVTVFEATDDNGSTLHQSEPLVVTNCTCGIEVNINGICRSGFPVSMKQTYV